MLLSIREVPCVVDLPVFPAIAAVEAAGPRLGTAMLKATSPRYLLVLSCVVLSGCAEFGNWLHNDFKVGPDYFKPAAPIADQWIDFNDRRVISDAHYVDDAAWWTAFGDPGLDHLMQVSFSENLSLRAASMRVLQAQSQRAIAAGFLLPQSQEAFGNYQHIQLSAAGNSLGLPQAALPRTLDFWSTGFNASWELDVWGRIRRDLESANANLDVSVENYDDVLVMLLAETALAYTEMREFEQRLAYARANVETQKGSLALAQSRFNNGAVSELDVTQARSNLAQTEALIPVLAKGLRLANNRLCVLLGTPPRDLRPEIGPGPIPETSSEVVVGIPADLLRRRPDVRRAEREVALQSAQIGVAVADLFPTFRINGTLSWSAQEFSDLFSSAANGGNIGPSFNWNILNYGRIMNNVRVQDARFQELAIKYQQTVLEANAETEDAIVSFLETQEQVKSLAESVTASERSVELALTQYREGAIDFNRVFNLESTLVQQQDQLAIAEAEVATSLIRIYKALGGGWQIRLQQHGAAPVAPELIRVPEPPEAGIIEENEELVAPESP